MVDVHAERELGRMESIIRQQYKDIDSLKQDVEHWKNEFKACCEAFEKLEEELVMVRSQLDERSPVEAVENGASHLEAAVLNTWGDRCPDFEPNCECCQAWAELDGRKP